MEQQQQTEAFSHELGLLIQRFAREFDLPLPSCIGVLEIHKHTLLSSHGMKEVPSATPRLANVARQFRPDLGGDTQTVLPTDWKLWSCDQSSGSEHLSDWGPEGIMRTAMCHETAKDRDVWLIDPSGRKHLPT